MNISLPESLKAFVEEQIEERGYGTSSEYIRELIRRERDRTQLRGLLLEGGASAPGNRDREVVRGHRAALRNRNRRS
jgi:antitoxin ParD1/3/4